MATTRKDEAPAGGQSPAKAASGDPAAPPALQDNSEDPTAFILSRARSEVHLLLDNISANPEVTIATLTERAKPKGLPKDWIEQVCEITWPRRDAEADPDDLAKQAALLIKTRDYLNGLAKPASGATIAFTLMVTQDTDAKARRRRRPVSDSTRAPSRTSLAAEAYPDLVEKARNFRVLLKGTLIFSAAVLLVTLLISWYLAVGNAALADYAAARTAVIEADARVGAAQSALNGDGAQPAAAPAFPPQSARRGAGSTPRAAVPAATAQSPQTAPQGAAQPATAPAAAPDQLAQPQPAAVSYLLHPCGRQRESFPAAALRDACLARSLVAERYLAVREGLKSWSSGRSWETASWLANLLGVGILPVLYGFLGAIAAVVRTLSRKIKASLLSPRDVQLTFQQLALGAVVGACISLFITPGAGNGETSVLGPVALSTSAVSFVAGFGVESVFKALEALISRIFNIAPAGGPPSRDTKAGA